jgi:hypothetical protein
MSRFPLQRFALALMLGAAPTTLAVAQSAAPALRTCTLKFKSTDYTTGTNPQSVVVGDFNHDGKEDFAQVNYSGGSAGSVGVFLGNGDGTFTLKGHYSTGAGPDALALADVNGDGNLDLVVGNDTGASVSVLLGNGDGTFQTHADYKAGSFPHWVAVADFNGDGKPDIAVANEGDVDVGVLLNKGDGTFGTMKTYPTSSEPYSVAAADFNHDGAMDLAVTGYALSVVSVLLGNGDGTFKNHVDYQTGTAPAVVVAGYLDKGKKIDLATANYNNGEVGSVSVLLGKGDGTFLQHADYTAGEGPDGLAIGSFNGDKFVDLAVANLIGGNLSILPGNGDGTFGTGAVFPTDKYPLGVAVGQFHRNRKTEQDLVVTNDLSTAATVFLNTSKGCE